MFTAKYCHYRRISTDIEGCEGPPNSVIYLRNYDKLPISRGVCNQQVVGSNPTAGSLLLRIVDRRQITAVIKICPLTASPLRRCVSPSARTREFCRYLVRIGTNLSSVGSARRDSRRLFCWWRKWRTIALPEAIGLLRSTRKMSPKYELLALSAADPLNLQGILTSGPRIAALTRNRLLFRDGLPIAALEAENVRKLFDDCASNSEIETALRVGKLRPSLRPYYN